MFHYQPTKHALVRHNGLFKRAPQRRQRRFSTPALNNYYAAQDRYFELSSCFCRYSRAVSRAKSRQFSRSPISVTLFWVSERISPKRFRDRVVVLDDVHASSPDALRRKR